MRTPDDTSSLASEYMWHVTPFLRWVCAPFLGLLPLVFFFGIIFTDGVEVGGFVFAVPWLYLCYRLWFRPFLKVTRSRLVIGNVFSTEELSWEEVATIEMSTKGSVLCLDTKDGRKIRIMATAQAPRASGGYIDEGRADEILHTLKRLQEERHLSN